MGRQAPQSQSRVAENSAFDTSRSTAPKLAIVSVRRLHCDKDICYINVWGKSY